MSQKALVILHPGFEEIEAVAPIDLLARAGIEVTQATIGADLQVTGRNQITFVATDHFKEVKNELFDVLILPGGPGINELRNHPQLVGCIKNHHEQGRLIACICAAPLLLKDAGVLTTHMYTAHPSVIAELPEAQNSAVVEDRNILTSRGAGTATEFALKIVERLCGSDTAQSIADSICAVYPIKESQN